jgi:outer membrane lipoprotein carrier protein
MNWIDMKRIRAAFATVAVTGALFGAAGCSYQDQTKDADTSTATTADATAAGGPAVVSAETASSSTDSSAAATQSPAAIASPQGPAKVNPPTRDADDGAAILARTAKKFSTINSMRADFTMAVENTLMRSTTNSAGKLYQKRPDKIALRFTQPEGDVIVGDGTYFWIYTPSSQAKNQALRLPAAAGGSNVVDLQAQFIGDPVKRFRYTLMGEETIGGRATDVMTLVPRDGAQYRSLKVWIDRNDSLVRRFEITEQSGVIRRMELKNLQINPAIDAATFRFTPPAGVHVVNQ